MPDHTYRFEVGATIGFSVSARNRTEADEKAERIHQQLANLADQAASSLAGDLDDIYLVIDDGAPDLIERESDGSNLEKRRLSEQ